MSFEDQASTDSVQPRNDTRIKTQLDIMKKDLEQIEKLAYGCNPQSAGAFENFGRHYGVAQSRFDEESWNPDEIKQVNQIRTQVENAKEFIGKSCRITPTRQGRAMLTLRRKQLARQEREQNRLNKIQAKLSAERAKTEAKIRLLEQQSNLSA